MYSHKAKLLFWGEDDLQYQLHWNFWLARPLLAIMAVLNSLTAKSSNRSSPLDTDASQWLFIAYETASNIMKWQVSIAHAYNYRMSAWTNVLGNLRPAGQMRPAWTFDMARIRIFVAQQNSNKLPNNRKFRSFAVLNTTKTFSSENCRAQAALRLEQELATKSNCRSKGFLPKYQQNR